MVNVAFSKQVWRANHMGSCFLLLAPLGRAISSAALRKKFLARNHWLRLIQDSDMAGLAGDERYQRHLRPRTPLGTFPCPRSWPC